MSLMPLKRVFIEAAINQRLEALLVEMPKHKCMVGIPGGLVNEKAEDQGTDIAAEYKKAKKNIKKMGLQNKGLETPVYFTLLKRAQQSESDISTYAAKVNFGSYSENIPPRPFLHTTFEGERMKRINKKAGYYLAQCAKLNTSAAMWLEKVGLYAAREVKKNIKEGDWEENSDITKAIKGSDKPLKDTGTMARAVTSWVKKK